MNKSYFWSKSKNIYVKKNYVIMVEKKKGVEIFWLICTYGGGCPKQPKMAVFGQKSEEQRKRGWVIESSIARTIIISWIVNILMIFEKNFFRFGARACGVQFWPPILWISHWNNSLFEPKFTFLSFVPVVRISNNIFLLRQL